MGAEADACSVAWAAGLFEGEGCFFLGRGRNDRVYLNLSIWSSDLDVLERFRDVIGVPNQIRTVKRTARPRDRKQMFALGASGAEATRVGELLRPWLGERRLTQLDDALLRVGENPPLKYQKLGDELALEARRLYTTGNVTLDALAKRFGVSITTIHYAVNGTRYRHLPPHGAPKPGPVSTH